MILGQTGLWLALFASHFASSWAAIEAELPAITAAPTANSIATRALIVPELFRRDGSCPANTFQCSQELGAAFRDICCQNGQTCALDANNNPACCPSGAVCTGTAPATAATAIAVSFVPNSYFSFPYAPTTYDNRDICTSAASACSKNYDTCVTVLEGGSGWGVTIAVPGGGGTTVAGGAAGLGASATPICSSLSSRACSNLEATPCSSYDESDSSTTRTNLKLLTVGAILVMLNLVS